MLKGDLTSTPLAPLLLQLADEEATGCLHISDAEGDEALAYFKAGLVYAVSVPGRRPQLGAKLVSSGALAPEALADALEAQRTELQGWRLGELLVHLGYVDQPVVEAFVKEQVHDALWDLMRWSDGRWKFRKNEKTREDVAPPMAVADLLADLRERGFGWETISAVIHGPTAVPVLSAGGGGAPETTLDPDAWSMLCKIDGERSVAELARDCGYTLFEAGQILVTLVSAGLVDIEEDLELAPGFADELGDQMYGASTVASALAAQSEQSEQAAEAAAEAAEAERAAADTDSGTDSDSGQPAVEEDGFAALARVVSEVAASMRDDDEAVVAPAASGDVPSPVLLHPGNDQSFASSLARVSEALNDVLGPPAVTSDPFDVPSDLRAPRRPRKTHSKVESPDAERRQRTRAAAAAELAAAHALAEALRAAQAEDYTPAAAEEQVGFADVVDLSVVRREAEEAARIEEQRLAAHAEREAADAEAARLEAERLAAEEEAARLEAERVAEEEAARLAAEETARVAAEEEAARLAAEEAARVAAEEEAARVAAEEEAERLAAEEAARVAAEEAARVAAEEAARVAAEEAARVAAEEEAARLAAEEAARVAAEEEAARVAAEEAARVAAEEAARVAAEEEAARLAAEEAARVATEEEAARLAAEEEAARVAAEEEEAARVAAEEATRLAAEMLAAELLAAEIADAEDSAWSEYWQREADAAQEAADRATSSAEASALLVELSTAIAEVPEQPTHSPDDDSPSPAEVADDEDAAHDYEPVSVGAPAMSEMADTAALLRELSSLGVDDDPPPPSTPPRAPRPAPAAAPPKKKRGLFGR